jgi:hypothetical protein
VKAIHAAVLTSAALVACVPTGSAPPYDAGAAPAATATFRPSLNVMTAPFEDNFDRPDSGEGAWSPFEAGTPGTPGAPGAPGAAPGHDGGSASAAIDAGRALAARDAGTDASAAATATGGDGGEAGSPLTVLLGDKDAGAETPPPPDRSNLGPNWVQIRTNAWRVEGGKLCVQNAHNHPVWLNRTLPVNARIEFDVTGYTDDGDLKAEVWGDGTSYATGTSYTNATSYLAVLGGWKNSLHVLARLNEHGTDRKEIRVDKDSDDPRQRPAQKGQTYHFKIERNDGKTVRWSVDGVDFVSWNDPAPLAGQGHDHFGFNEWEAKVCFDNVKVTPL